MNILYGILNLDNFWEFSEFDSIFRDFRNLEDRDFIFIFKIWDLGLGFGKSGNEICFENLRSGLVLKFWDLGLIKKNPR